MVAEQQKLQEELVLTLEGEQATAAVDEPKGELILEIADADERGHAVFAMVDQLMEKISNIDSRAKGESSGQRPAPTAGGTEERGANVSPSPSFSLTGREGMPAEVGPSRNQSGRRGLGDEARSGGGPHLHTGVVARVVVADGPQRER